MFSRLIQIIFVSSFLFSCSENCERKVYKIQETEYKLVPKSGYNVRFFLKANDSIFVIAKSVEGEKIDFICLASAIYISKGIGRPIACSDDVKEVNWKFHILEGGEYAVYIKNNSNEIKRYYLNTYYVRCEWISGSSFERSKLSLL